MRTILFVSCFSLGVSLMVLSGYVPRAATAEPSGPDFSPATPQLPGRYTTPIVPGQPTTDQPTGDDLPPPPFDETPAPPSDDLGLAADDIPPVDDLPGPVASPGDADTPTESAPDHNTAPTDADPLANAGPNRVVWIGWNEITLDGSASTGEGLTYHWTQLSGPTTLLLQAPRRPVTSATGLPISLEMGWTDSPYEFELTVRDREGREASDIVVFTVAPGPELKITPKAQRHFETRDDFILAVYETWVANPETDVFVFKINSPVSLNFTKISGAAYEVEGGPIRGGRYSYRITVLGHAAELSSCVELLVDTEDRVPAVVRLGMTWEYQ